jgi:signal transduction histidine kinase
VTYSSKFLRNPHFWGILIIFLVCVILHYSQQIPFLAELKPLSLLGLSRHAVERVLLLAPIIYAGFVFGLKAGLICLAAALTVMLPRVFLFSPNPADALFESLAVIAVGAVINWWFESQRRERRRRDEALMKLEAVQRQLQSHIQIVKENEIRLSGLHFICTVVNESLVLEEVLDTAADKIKEVMGLDVVLLFFLDEETEQLELRGHRGVSEEFVSGIAKLGVGEGFNGRVAQTGEPCLIEDSGADPRLSREVVRTEGLKSQFIVPLKSKDKVIGTLCAAMYTPKQFTAEEKQLLIMIGLELGVAAEKAYLYEQSQKLQESVRLYANQISNAHEEERMRIARELHDDTVQTMVAASRYLDNLVSQSSIIPEEDLERLKKLQKEIDNALIRARRFIQDLRPPTLEYLGLLPALKELTAQIQEQSGIKVNLQKRGLKPNFTAEQELLIYRIAQEALRNIWKHSEATKAEIVLSFNHGNTNITISDNGKGFEVSKDSNFLKSGKLGLMGMTERAHLLGGNLTFSSRSNGGTIVIVDIPSEKQSVKGIPANGR